MKEKTQANSLAERLRAKGYVPLPRLWIKSDAIPEIHAVAERFKDEITEERNKLGREIEIEKLWAAREREQTLPDY